MALTLDEAIRHCYEVYHERDDMCKECREEHRQLARWLEELRQLKIVNATEVKHSEWILHSDGSGTCKICGKRQNNVWDMDNWQNFCGHCGAKMDGGKAE